MDRILNQDDLIHSLFITTVILPQSALAKLGKVFLHLQGSLDHWSVA
jgi:hypothetical protein